MSPLNNNKYNKFRSSQFCHDWDSPLKSVNNFLISLIMLFAFVTQAQALENADTNPDSGLAAFVDKLKHKSQEDADILPPDQAFKLSVATTENDQIIAHFEVAPGHYLYHDRIKF